jgi:hypothetical protein
MGACFGHTEILIRDPQLSFRRAMLRDVAAAQLSLSPVIAMRCNRSQGCERERITGTTADGRKFAI